ncbi:proliferation marker protein Ki-67 isoform X2 [Notamacropus eugenii]|uniref:proliferation marker protein Ki-67 isoform X2 n=1 Tax=Notamacropus eugenii TaxID=9315 RepID=UPI003B66DCC1
MNTFGYIVIIKRTGSEGHRYPLSQRACLFGRGTECDIRLQLPVVSRQQCKIEFNEQLEAILINLNSANPTQLNGAAFYHPVKLEHGDLITIFDRSFRFEYENASQNEGKPRRSSEPRIKMVTPTRSRSASILDSEQCERRDQSFRDTPTKYSEENITRQFSPVHSLEEKANANESKKDDDASDNVEEHFIGKVPTLKTKELKENTTNVIENTVSTDSGGSDGSGRSDGNGGDVSLFSTLEQPGKSGKGYFSPFSELFGLMKEELSCKSQQIGDLNHSSRKSGAASQVSMDGKEWEAELLHLPGSRPLRRSKTLKHITISGAEKEGGTFKELWLEDPFKNYSSEKVIVKAQDQELQQLSTPRKRRKSEELPAENSGERKNKTGKEARRRSAPVGPLSEAKSQHSLYPLRSQTKTPEMCSLRSSRLSKLGREALEAQKSKATPAEKPILKESDSNGTGEFVDLTKNKGSSKGNKNQLTPKKASNSEQISKKIQDELDFEDTVIESDGLSAKRRRVSFGVHLRPELFDENLPPNTPVKKGESPGIRRTSFGNCPPRAVLKKPIIKQEHSKLPEKEPPSTSLVEGMLHVQDLSLELPASPKKISSASSEDISQSYFLDENAMCVPVEIQPQKTVNTPSYSRRSSGRRSQYDTLQRIYAKRRSGASEANLMVVHSWADVVRLGTRKPQTGVVVKHGLERRVIKKQKRLTPKKPANEAQNHFSTGHANSPCTIVIGRAHTEKVTAPIRPCRMLNNFVLNPNMDMNEDLTGLADMFETPMKQKPQSPETGTTLQHLSEEQSSFSGDASSGPTSERVMIPFIPDTARQISGQSITCRRSPRNRQSWRGDDEMSIKALREISEIRSDKIMKIPLPDIDVDHKILTPSSKRQKTSTPKENVPTPYLNRIETPDQIESATHDTQKVNLGRSMNQSVALGGEQHSEMATPNSGARILEDICVKGASEIPSNKGEQPKENSVDIHIDLRDQKPKMSEGQLGVTTSLKIGSDKEQPVTDHLAGNQKHVRISLQNEKYSPTGSNKMIKQKPDIVSLDVLTTPGTVTIKNELGGIKKIIKTPKEKIEPVDDLIGIREIMTSPTQMVAEIKDGENKVADSAGNDVSIQKNLRTTPKQVVCSAEGAEVPKKLMRTVKQQTEVQDLTNTEQLMSTPKRKCESVEHLTMVKRLMRTPKDKVEPGEDVAGNERLMRTPKEKELVESHKSNRNVNVRQTPKQKGQSIEDMVGISRLTHVPKEKREPPEDLTGPKEPMSTPKQIIEPVKDQKVNQAIMKKSSPKYESGDLTCIKRLMRTPTVKGGEPVEDLTGIKRLMRTPREKGEPVEDLTGIKRLMRTPKVKGEEPAEDLTGIKRLMRTPKVKGEEPAEDLTGIKRLMRTPKVKGAEPAEDLTGIKRLMRTPKVKGAEPAEDLTGIKRLMRTPKVKGAEPAEDLTGIKRLMRTPKVKGAEPAEDLTGIKRLMRTPKVKGAEPAEDLTGIKRLMRTPKVKGGEPIEDLTGIKRLMRTPKVKRGEPVEDLTGIKRLMRSPKVKGEPVEDLTGIKRLMRTPKVKRGEPVEDLTGIKRLMRSPKVKGEPVEDLTGIKRLMRSPKEKGEVLEDLTDVIMFMETPDKVAENISSRNTVMQSNSQEISDIDSEFSEKIQEIVILRRPAIKDFSGSNFEAEPKSKESSLEIDYTELKEMFESPEESKDQTMDQCQQKICSNPCEEDESQSNISKIDGLCSVNLEDNIMDQGILSLFTQRNKISQAVREHDDLPSKTENTFTEKKAKKSLLSFHSEIKAKSDNQRTISLRSRSKTKSDSESLGSTKIHLKNDEKIVKKTWEKSVKEVVEDQARVTSQSIGRFCKTDKRLQEANSLSHSEKEEKEEHVESEPRMSGDTDDNTKNMMVPLRPRRRNQADKEGKTNSSDMSDIESSEMKSVKNLRESLYNAGVTRTLRSRNKNREPPSESDVSHTDDKKKLGKRLPRKVNEKITPLRFSRRNKTNKELQGSSPLLSEVDILAREKNENKGKALRSRNRIKTDTKLQESNSLVSDVVSSHTEGYEKKSVKVLKEKTLEKKIGMMALRSKNKNNEMFLSESDKSCTDDEKESVKSLPKKLKEQKILLDSRNRNNTIEELNSLSGETGESYAENDGKYVKSCQRKTVSVNEDGRALRTRNINKTSTDAACIENREKKPMGSLRSSTRSKGAKESQEPNVSPAKVLNKLQIANDEKKPVKAFQKLKDASPNKEMAASRSRSRNKVDKESQESNILSRETDSLYKSFPGKFMSLRSRSQNQIGPETQEIACTSVENSENKPLESLQEKKLKENTANKASLRSGNLKDEKNLPVKVQKNLNDATGNGEMMSLRSRSKNKMDTGLKVPTSRTYTEKDAEKSMSTFPGIFKNPVILEGILPLTRNRRNKADKLKEISHVFSATDIVEADEKKLSSLENKAGDKVEESFRTGSRNEVDGELCDFPLLSVTNITYTEKNKEETEKIKILKDKVVTEDMTSLIKSRLRNQNDSALIVSNPLPKTVDISPLVEDGKENIVQIFPDKCLNKTGGIISQASPAGTRLRNKSDSDLQRSTNLRKDEPSAVASKTTVVTAGKRTAKKAKNWKQVNRGKLRTANIKLSEPTDVENYTIPDNLLLKSAPEQDDTFKVTFVSAKETQLEPLLKEGSILLNNTNQTGENDALSGNEIWPRRLSNNKEQPDSQERGTLGSRRKYTLRETKRSTRRSKQNNSKQTARKNIKA